MREVDPAQTDRGQAFSLWMSAPMPMVTLCKTFDVTNLLRVSRRSRRKFNLLLCWCIGRAASQVKEFYLLPVGDKLMAYDRLAVNTVVATDTGDISTCDVPFCDDLDQFDRDYTRLTGQVRATGRPYDLEDHMVIGTSALTQTYIDGAVNIYTGFYNNPFLTWGRYRKRLWRAELPISFQFHHTQMDGGHAARFLDALQREIAALRSA